MDLKRLRTFVSVTELGSISAAAQKLRITQPALSRQLQDLQAEFGVRLFDQVGRRLHLSQEGEALLPLCRDLLHRADDVLEHARSLGAGDAGVLRIGATPQVIANMLPGFLREFALLYPRVQVRTVEAGAIEQINMLRAREIDVAIAMPLNEAETAGSHFLCKGHVVAAFLPHVAHETGDVLDVRDLAGLPLLLPRVGFGTRWLFDAACRMARIAPTIAHESSGMDTLQSLAREGLGVAILPITARPDKARLRVVPLTFRGQLLSGDLVLLWGSQRRRPHYAQHFATELAAHMQALVQEFAPPTPVPRARGKRTRA